MSESALSIASVVSLLTTTISGTISTLASICTLVAVVALIVRITLRLLGSILGRSLDWNREDEEPLTCGLSSLTLLCCFFVMVYLVTVDGVPYSTARWSLVALCAGRLFGVGTVVLFLSTIYRLHFEWSRIRSSSDPPTLPLVEHNTSDLSRGLSSDPGLYRVALTKYRAARERHTDAMKSYVMARTEMEQAWDEAERAIGEVARALYGKKSKQTV